MDVTNPKYVNFHKVPYCMPVLYVLRNPFEAPQRLPHGNMVNAKQDINC